MQKSNEKGLKKTAKLTGAIVFIVVFTALMALLGFHLASRYRATIMGLFDNVTEKISGIESDIREEAEIVVSMPESKK